MPDVGHHGDMMPTSPCGLAAVFDVPAWGAGQVDAGEVARAPSLVFSLSPRSGGSGDFAAGLLWSREAPTPQTWVPVP